MFSSSVSGSVTSKRLPSSVVIASRSPAEAPLGHTTASERGDLAFMPIRSLLTGQARGPAVTVLTLNVGGRNTNIYEFDMAESAAGTPLGAQPLLRMTQIER